MRLLYRGESCEPAGSSQAYQMKTCIYDLSKIWPYLLARAVNHVTDGLVWVWAVGWSLWWVVEGWAAIGAARTGAD
jgi:hypothetical protein